MAVIVVRCFMAKIDLYKYYIYVARKKFSEPLFKGIADLQRSLKRPSSSATRLVKCCTFLVSASYSFILLLISYISCCMSC